jgi:hypothetical protein
VHHPSIELTITPAARQALASIVERHREFEAIIAIVWGTNNAGESEWLVGFYDRASVADEFVVEAGGVEIVVEPQWREELSGMQLGLEERHFVVQPRG